MSKSARLDLSAGAASISSIYATQPTVQKQIFESSNTSGRRRKAQVLFSYSAFHEPLDSRTFHVLTVRAHNKTLGTSMARDLFIYLQDMFYEDPTNSKANQGCLLRNR